METCKVKGCESPVLVKSRRLCSKHYYRWQRHGDPEMLVRHPQPKTCLFDGCHQKPSAKGYCCTHYGRLKRNGDPAGVRTPNGLAQKFINSIVASTDGFEKPFDDSPCIIWPFFRELTGYGMWHPPNSRKPERVHRTVCKLVNGEPKDGKNIAIHTCERGHLGCCSPDCLVWGTQHENVIRCIHAGNAHTKLLVDDIRFIRSTDKPLFELAEQFGVHIATIDRIIKRKTWKHVH